MTKFIKNQSGRSMVEMLGVLAIIGVLSVGGIAGYSMAMQKWRTTQAIEEIQMILTNTRTLFASQSDYDGLDTPLLLNAGILQEGSTSTVGKSPFPNSDITVEADTTKKNFIVKITNVPAGSCVPVSTSNWGNLASGFVSVSIAENKLVPEDATSGTKATVSEASKACAGTTNNLSFEFN